MPLASAVESFRNDFIAAAYAAIDDVAGGTRKLAGGSAESSAAALTLEKNAAVRAFCTATSVPKIGASGERIRPRIAPAVSTTVTDTCAAEPTGTRICARARLATSRPLWRI